MTPDDLVELLQRERAFAILRTTWEAAAAPALRAAIRAGFRIVELTLNTPGALRRIKEFSADRSIVVGAGTVLTRDQAQTAVEHGARFLVSPVVDLAVIAAAAELGVAMMAGAHTPTEMLAAHEAGAPLQKLFPAAGLGPSYVRACLGPLPFLRIVPTHGVDGDTAADYLDAGAHAVGFVNPLFDPALMRDGNFDEIERRGRALLASIA